MYEKVESDLNKINSKIHIIELGETFTLIANDLGSVYSWGNNEFNQLGRNNKLQIGYISNFNIYFYLV